MKQKLGKGIIKGDLVKPSYIGEWWHYWQKHEGCFGNFSWGKMRIYLGFRHEELEVVVGRLVDVSSRSSVASQPLGVPCPAWSMPLKLSRKYCPQNTEKLGWIKPLILRCLFIWFNRALPMPHLLRVFMAGPCASCHLLWMCHAAGVQTSPKAAGPLPPPPAVEHGLCFLSLRTCGREDAGMLVPDLKDCDIDSFGSFQERPCTGTPQTPS